MNLIQVSEGTIKVMLCVSATEQKSNCPALFMQLTFFLGEMGTSGWKLKKNAVPDIINKDESIDDVITNCPPKKLKLMMKLLRY